MKFIITKKYIDPESGKHNKIGDELEIEADNEEEGWEKAEAKCAEMSTDDITYVVDGISVETIETSNGLVTDVIEDKSFFDEIEKIKKKWIDAQPTKTGWEDVKEAICINKLNGGIYKGDVLKSVIGENSSNTTLITVSIKECMTDETESIVVRTFSADSCIPFDKSLWKKFKKLKEKEVYHKYKASCYYKGVTDLFEKHKN